MSTTHHAFDVLCQSAISVPAYPPFLTYPFVQVLAAVLLVLLVFGALRDDHRSQRLWRAAGILTILLTICALFPYEPVRGPCGFERYAFPSLLELIAVIAIFGAASNAILKLDNERQDIKCKTTIALVAALFIDMAGVPLWPEISSILSGISEAVFLWLASWIY